MNQEALRFYSGRIFRTGMCLQFQNVVKVLHYHRLAVAQPCVNSHRLSQWEALGTRHYRATLC